MNNRIWINKIKTNNNTEILLDKNDIVVFVGPNNAGKSESLREINKLLRTNEKNPTKIITNIEIEKKGSDSELIEDISSFSQKTNTPESLSGYEIGYIGYKFNLSEKIAISRWRDYKKGIGDLHTIFVNLLTTEGRLVSSNPPSNISITEPPTHPIHFLQRDDRLEEKFSTHFHQIFGKDLIVHRNAGKNVPLYVGEKPERTVENDRVSKSYCEKLEKLPTLETQGDGMRSFVGVLLNSIVSSSHSILLIDEPEAFLHPPQARLLGKMLAEDRPNDKQLILATHSEDFLKGLLDSKNKNIKVIRIRRDGDSLINETHQLNKDDIEEIWSDSLLRHSNILNGLFHSKVVLCEGDADCRFYSAVLYSIYEETSKTISDILFIHCGGKHKMPIIIRALKRLDVPLNVVADFDILNDENPLKEIINELHGDWDAIKKDWNIVKKSIDAKREKYHYKEALKAQIEVVFKDTSEEIMPKEKIEEINDLLKKSSPWAEAKRSGKAFIPAGDATNAFSRLNNSCNKAGLKIVEVGEVEGFVKSVGGHGPNWVNTVLEKNLMTDRDFDEAKAFVRGLVN